MSRVISTFASTCMSMWRLLLSEPRNKHCTVIIFGILVGSVDCYQFVPFLQFILLHLFFIYSFVRCVEENISPYTISEIFSEWKMFSLTARMIDCLKTSNLTMEELDRITDNVGRTLIHPKGNEIFASYLVDFPDSSACLSVYNKCTSILNEEQNRMIQGDLSDESIVSLITKVRLIQEFVIDMEVIDFCIIKKLIEALKVENKENRQIRRELLDVLESIKVQCQDGLRKMHDGFRRYILEYKNMPT